MTGIRWLLVAALFLLPAVSHALGLGRLKVHSALNEPLNAEIEFTSITDKELKGLNASLATRADFDAAGIERQPYLATIKFTVAKRLDGRYILQLQTDQPLDEPFMHFLLQIEWPGGRVVREYSALIDPPVQITGKPPQVETPSTAAPAPEPAPAAEPEPVPAQAAPEPAPSAKPETPTTAATPSEALLPPPPPEQAQPVAEAPAAEAPKPAADKPLGAAQAPQDVRIDKETGWPILDGGAAPAPEAAPTASAPSVEKLDARPEPAPAAEKPEPAPTATAEPSVPSTSPSWSRVAEYHVKQGDTMWAIAERVRGDRKIALEQVVLAIYRTNRTAFFGNNVNNLRAGKILKIPEREAVDQMPLADARREFRAQYDVWQEYKLKLASAGREVKVPAEATREPEPPAKPAEESRKPAEAKPAEEKPPVKQAESKPVKPVVPPAGRAPQEELLRIVRSNIRDEKKKGTPDKQVETEAVKDAKERQALAQRVASLEESAISREMQARDLSDKIGAVRAQLKREKRLMEMENQRLAETTRKPAPEKAAATKPEDKAKETPKPAEAKKPEEKKPEDKKPEAAAAPVKPKPPVEVRKAPPPRRPPPAAPPKEEKGFVAEMMDTVLGSDLLPIILGGVVLVSGLVAVVYMRRRRRAIGEFEESILSSSEGTTDQPLMTTDTSGQAVPAGDTSFLSDFSQGGVGASHTDEVDPVAEAEVYLAYGRDETAEEILKDAIIKNPERQELKVKLLEIYHQRNDVRGFETLAEELYASMGGRGGSLWQKVEDMGRKLNPENPMFKGGAPATAPKKPERTMAGMSDTMTSPGLTAPAAAATGAIDFNQTMQAEAPSASASETSIDFDLGFTQAPSAESPSQVVEPEALGSADADLGDIDLGAVSDAPASNSVDFDLGGLSSESPAVEEPAEPQAPAADSGLDFNFGTASDESPSEVAVAEQSAGGGESGSAQWDETATKLDLAKAYIDMGDSEGARSILDEVMSEGNDTQKKQAQELSSQLG